MNGLDFHTSQHFSRWLERTVPACDRAQVQSGILALLRGDPGLLEDRSWPELRALAEGGAR